MIKRSDTGKLKKSEKIENWLSRVKRVFPGVVDKRIRVAVSRCHVKAVVAFG